MTEQTMEPLAKHTTFRIGGPADYYLIPESRHEVREAVLYAKEKKLPFYILGKGSNVLFSDEGFRGVVIEVGKGMSGIALERAGVVRVQAGTSMSAMAAKMAEWGLAGFEFAAGIPGTLGGGIAMNAGAYNGEIKDCILTATVLDQSGRVRILKADELELGYRTSIIQKEEYIVLEAEFYFESGNPEGIKAIAASFLV